MPWLDIAGAFHFCLNQSQAKNVEALLPHKVDSFPTTEGDFSPQRTPRYGRMLPPGQAKITEDTLRDYLILRVLHDLGGLLEWSRI
jgi:hypothetical protein